MRVKQLAPADVDWAVEVLTRRRRDLLTSAPIFWNPAANNTTIHTTYLRTLLTQKAAQGYRTDNAVLIAARAPDHYLVDDAAWWNPREGTALWNAFASDHLGEKVRAVCPRYEPSRLELFQDVGLRTAETWWLCELPGTGGGTPGIDVTLPGGMGRTVSAPPVYAPPGPILVVSTSSSLARLAPASISSARRLGCAGAVIAVPEPTQDDLTLLRAAGFRPHCDFLEGLAALASS